MAGSLSQSESDSSMPKRMRLGTRSCTECRRRKVRCTFASNSAICENCVLHGSRCTPQQARHPASARASQRQKENLQQRLDGLEGIVRQICGAVGIEAESSTLADFETGASEALRRLQPGLQSQSSLYNSTSQSGSLTGSSSFAPSRASFSSSDQFDEAPLLGLFKDALLLQDDEAQALNIADIAVDPRTQACIEGLQRLIPTYDDLTGILALTSEYWSLWPTSPMRPGTEQFQDRKVAEARSYILECLDSDMPAVVAKAALWLSLCLQQLPKDFVSGPTSLPAPLRVLLESYLSAADTLLSLDGQTGGSIEILEGLCLQSRFYLDAGKPQKSWFHIRHALNVAVLMGLPRIDAGQDIVKANLWTQIWQTDRTMSVMLGLPYGITETHPSLSKPPAPDTFSRALYGLAIMAGHVTDRNQNLDTLDYSVTAQIDQELTHYKIEIIDSWDAPTPGLPLQILFGQAAIKIQFFMLQKFLHLPYMLRWKQDPTYKASRIAALEACRNIIKSYHELRDNSGPSTVMCDVMDFQVFSATVTIIVDLLSENPRSITPDSGEDWHRVQMVTRSLQHVTSSIDCAVASQAAQLLTYLYRVHHGAYTGPELYEAVIPYFGRVKIRRPRNVFDTTASTTTAAETLVPSDPSDYTETLSPSVEFSMHSVSHNSLSYPLSQEELGLEWTSTSDDSSVNYDWTQWFSGTPSI